MTKMQDMTVEGIARDRAELRLRAAAKKGDADVLRSTLRAHPDMNVDATDIRGNSALHYAAGHAGKELRENMVGALVEAGANMGLRNKQKKTPHEMMPEPKGFVARLTGKREQAPATATMSV